MKITQPIFLIASERSGSNLIRAIIGSHSRIASPPSPQVLHYFLPKLHLYGDLNQSENKNALQDDFTSMINNQLSKWDVELQKSDYPSDASFLDIFNTAYAKQMAQQGKDRVFFKEIEMFHYAEILLGYYPDAKFVYLVRDGRDCVLSAMNSPNHVGSVEELAVKWSIEQQKSLQTIHFLKERSQVFIIHYEDLVAYPEEQAAAICEFLELGYEPEMLEYYKKKEFNKQADTVKNWSNLKKPILKENLEKYKTKLSADQISIIEQYCYKELVSLGYPLKEVKPEEAATMAGSKGKRTKLFQLAGKILTGKTMSVAEMKNRSQQMGALNQITKRLNSSPGVVYGSKYHNSKVYIS